jgi:CxxC motif-containing protein (DUF1111 family)
MLPASIGLITKGRAMEISQITQWAFRLKHSAACGAVTVFATVGLAIATNAADEPAQQRSPAVSVATKSTIDGAEIFAREWIPGDKRSHGGDGLGPVFNDSSCVACHNQGGIGGAGPASKNVDIVTAFHAPQQRNRQAGPVGQLTVPQTLPGIFFQSVFGNLDNVASQKPADPDVPQQEAQQAEPQKQLSPAERAVTERKKQAELRKTQIEADRKTLAKLHPGFAFANSVVLHKGATFAGYETWRSQVAGMRFGGKQQSGVEMMMFSPQVMVEEEPILGTRRGKSASSNGGMVMAQLKQQVQMARLNGGNASARQGNFVITKSQRNTTALFGAGLIDSIPTKVLEELEAAQAKNKVVSGRVARLKDGSAGRRRKLVSIVL